MVRVVFTVAVLLVVVVFSTGRRGRFSANSTRDGANNASTTARRCSGTSGSRGGVTLLLAEAGAVAVMAGGSEVAVLLAGVVQY